MATGGEDVFRESFREYASTIFLVEEEGMIPIQARIADWLRVSRASVSEMIHRMEKEGLVVVAGSRSLELTTTGRELAEEVVRRHRLSELFLDRFLGLPWRVLHEEGERWEMVISGQVEEAMCVRLGDPKTCPHGNPIPGSGYVRPPMKPVSEMIPGEMLPLGRISSELESDEEALDLLDKNGFLPGKTIRFQSQSNEGVRVVIEPSLEVQLPSFIAERLFVVVS